MALNDQYSVFHRKSIEQPEQFWEEQAHLIDWHAPWTKVLDYSNPPHAKWFKSAQTNICHNAVDRHLTQRANQPALIYISTETGIEQTYTYSQLHKEVNRVAAMLESLGVQTGDRVLIYMPMIAQAVFAMLACTRIGAIHSVVFGGFASTSLAARIDDAKPRVILSADAGSRSGKVIEYKPLLDEAIRLASNSPEKVVVFNRGLAPVKLISGRDLDWDETVDQHNDTLVPCTWLESNEPSYILYTSGTTGKPKGVVRDTGGYAVALAASIKYIYQGNPGETFFTTSDIGWVVGHSYIVYAPLIAGMTTVVYDGTPLLPDASIWWKIVQEQKVSIMFSAPTAIRVLKRQDPAFLSKYDISSLRTLFLAGEPLDEPTARWIADAIHKPVIDNYWQTESGWPILAVQRGVDPSMPVKIGSPGKPAYGYNVQLLDELTGEEVAPGEKAVLAILGPLPPGCLTTVWGDDKRYISTYWSLFKDKPVYSTFDWGIRDGDGYYFILGRTDDVINVAGHRLGTREIEESINDHPNIVETAVVGIEDKLKGQVAVGFAIAKDASLLTTEAARNQLEGEIMAIVEKQLGAIARPSRVYFVTALPKTRSGKMLRRAIQAVCEGRDPGDITTIDDPAVLHQIQDALAF
ncbi:MAG TPA: propionate--CoA ligase [Eoetvoesiella sp.]